MTTSERGYQGHHEYAFLLFEFFIQARYTAAQGLEYSIDL